MPSTSSPSSGLFNYRLAQQMITKQSTLLDELAILYCIEQHCVLMMQEKPTIQNIQLISPFISIIIYFDLGVDIVLTLSDLHAAFASLNHQ